MTEQIVKRRVSISNYIIRFAMIVLCVLSPMLELVIGGLAIGVVAVMIYLTWLVFKATSIEYEYAFFPNDFTVDRIAGQRKRKRVAEFEMDQIDLIAKIDDEELTRMAFNVRKIDFTTDTKSDNVYGMMVNGNKGQALVMFEPNEKMLEALKNASPRKLK